MQNYKLDIKACIFDLDGVIVDTAKYHYAAWKKLANALGFDFDEQQNEQLKGVSRVDSLERILQWGSIELSAEEKIQWAAQKNDWYLEFIKDITSAEILPGILPFLNDLKNNSIKIGLGTASKNASLVTELLEIKDYFDVAIDGNQVVNGKPDPEVFLKGAEAMGILPKQCIVFEDAVSGVTAALKGGFMAVGIGDPTQLGQAHFVTPNLLGYSLGAICKLLNVE